MIVLIDNYDSFSYNLYQLIGELSPDIKVIRNDEMTAAQVAELKPDAIVLSPGPGRPKDAGICVDVVKRLAGQFPILGVCLGHQSICEAFGGVIGYAKELMHGKVSVAKLDTECVLFHGMNPEMNVARYHSLALEPNSLPECLSVVAETADGEVMAVAHREYKIYGLQFHPESVLTPEGKTVIKNFLNNI